MDRIFLPRAAAEAILAEVLRHPSCETGGVLCGKWHGNCWRVQRVCIPGDRAQRQIAGFTFDPEDYDLSYSCGEPGLWHKHNHALMPAFSRQDEAANRAFAAAAGGKTVSALVQKSGRGHDLIAYSVTQDGSRRLRICAAGAADTWRLNPEHYLGKEAGDSLPLGDKGEKM